MISVKIWKTGQQYKGFVCEGHAGYAEAGSDIVCAAVSALTINTVNSLEQFTEDAFEVEQAEDGGYLKLNITGELSLQAEILMKSLVLGLQTIEENYGSEFLTVSCQDTERQISKEV